MMLVSMLSSLLVATMVLFIVSAVQDSRRGLQRSAERPRGLDRLVSEGPFVQERPKTGGLETEQLLATVRNNRAPSPADCDYDDVAA